MNFPLSTRPGRGEAARTARARRQAGFTLLELLVVLVILGLLATIAAPQAIKYLGGAKTKTAQAQIESLGTTLDLYRLEVGGYPPQEQGLQALLEKPSGVEGWDGPYVRKEQMIVDPWGRPYHYRYPGEHLAFDLYTLGADNAEGGDGEDQDVTNW